MRHVGLEFFFRSLSTTLNFLVSEVDYINYTFGFCFIIKRGKFQKRIKSNLCSKCHTLCLIFRLYTYRQNTCSVLVYTCYMFILKELVFVISNIYLIFANHQPFLIFPDCKFCINCIELVHIGTHTKNTKGFTFSADIHLIMLYLLVHYALAIGFGWFH